MSDERAARIIYAGYGYLNKTINVTAGITKEYNDGMRVFIADNRFGVPDIHNVKYLYIVWQIGSEWHSGVAIEANREGILIN